MISRRKFLLGSTALVVLPGLPPLPILPKSDDSEGLWLVAIDFPEDVESGDLIEFRLRARVDESRPAFDYRVTAMRRPSGPWQAVNSGTLPRFTQGTGSFIAGEQAIG